MRGAIKIIVDGIAEHGCRLFNGVHVPSKSYSQYEWRQSRVNLELLTNAIHTLDVDDIERILQAQIA